MTDDTGGKICSLPATGTRLSLAAVSYTRVLPLHFLVHTAKLLNLYGKLHRLSKSTSTRGRKRLKINFVALLREDQFLNEPH